MIDCLTCHRLHRNGGTLYCPFLNIQPCIRGQHRIGEEPELEEEKQEEHKPSEKTPPNKPGRPPAYRFPPSFYEYPPPAFTPPRARNGGNVIDWAAVHDKIFRLIREDCSVYEIASIIGVHPSTMAAYLRRYNTEEWAYIPPKGK